MKRLFRKTIQATISISDLNAMDLINLLNQTLELKGLDISLEEAPDGILLLAVGDTVYEIEENKVI